MRMTVALLRRAVMMMLIHIKKVTLPANTCLDWVCMFSQRDTKQSEIREINL